MILKLHPTEIEFSIGVLSFALAYFSVLKYTKKYTAYDLIFFNNLIFIKNQIYKKLF